MFLSKTLHTELLKAAEQNGVNKMLTWGGVGAGVGGAYGMFSDTGTTMEGAFKGAILGGGAAAGLKYYGNKYATGMMHTSNTIDLLPGIDAVTFAGKTGKDFNETLNNLGDFRRLSSGFDPRFIGIGGKAKFSDDVLGARGYNNKIAERFSTLNKDFNEHITQSGKTRENFVKDRLNGFERNYNTSIYGTESGMDFFGKMKGMYNPD